MAQEWFPYYPQLGRKYGPYGGILLSYIIGQEVMEWTHSKEWVRQHVESTLGLTESQLYRTWSYLCGRGALKRVKSYHYKLGITEASLFADAGDVEEPDEKPTTEIVEYFLALCDEHDIEVAETYNSKQQGFLYYGTAQKLMGFCAGEMDTALRVLHTAFIEHVKQGLTIKSLRSLLYAFPDVAKRAMDETEWTPMAGDIRGKSTWTPM